MRTIRIGSSLARRYPRTLRVEREQAELRRHESLRPAAALTLLVMALLLGACAGSDSSALPGGDGTTTGVPSSSEPATESTDSPSPTESDWESAFTPDDLAEYDDALARWESYERESERLWSNPSPGPDTLAFFASYFYNEQLVEERLEQYADPEVDVEVVGLPTVLWSRALRIQEQSVRVQQCVDYSSVQTTQHGKPIEGESQRPLLREIDLSVPAGETKYLIQQIHDPSWGRRVTTCKA